MGKEAAEAEAAARAAETSAERQESGLTEAGLGVKRGRIHGGEPLDQRRPRAPSSRLRTRQRGRGRGGEEA